MVSKRFRVGISLLSQSMRNRITITQCHHHYGNFCVPNDTVCNIWLLLGVNFSSREHLRTLESFLTKISSIVTSLPCCLIIATLVIGKITIKYNLEQPEQQHDEKHEQQQET